MRFIVLMLLAMVSGGAAADIFKCVTPKGDVFFTSDRVEATAKACVQITTAPKVAPKVAAPPTVDFAVGWVKIGSSSSSGGSDIYVDPATIRRAGNMVKMWDMGDYKTAQVSQGDGARYFSTKGQSEYDCKDERLRRLFLTWHSGNMGSGDVVSTTDRFSNWQPVAPGSVGEAAWKYACGKR